MDTPDPSLREAVCKALRKPTGAVTVADMASLTELDASRLAQSNDAPLIDSLEGLQSATNLTKLDLSGSDGGSVRNLGTGELSPLAGPPGSYRVQVSGFGQ